MFQNKSGGKPKQTANFNVKKSVLLVISLVLFLAFLLSLVFGVSQFQKNKDLSTRLSQKDVKSDKTDYVKSIGKLMVLPDEVPTLATVSDKKKLANQSFFQDSENGDKVLIYSKAKKAILYRPAINKIIDVSSIVVSQKVSESSGSGTITAKKIKVVIYNGTKIPGKAGGAKKQITATFPNITVVKTGNSKNDYSQTFVYDITGGNSELVSSLAKILGGTVSSLSSSETYEEADIFIVIGK